MYVCLYILLIDPFKMKIMNHKYYENIAALLKLGIFAKRGMNNMRLLNIACQKMYKLNISYL